MPHPTPDLTPHMRSSTFGGSNSPALILWALISPRLLVNNQVLRATSFQTIHWSDKPPDTTNGATTVDRRSRRPLSAADIAHVLRRVYSDRRVASDTNSWLPSIFGGGWRRQLAGHSGSSASFPMFSPHRMAGDPTIAKIKACRRELVKACSCGETRAGPAPSRQALYVLDHDLRQAVPIEVAHDAARRELRMFVDLPLEVVRVRDSCHAT